MPGYRSPLDAYREDLSRAPGRKRLAAGDEFWIVLATGLRRLHQAPPRSRPAAARRLAAALETFERDMQQKRPAKRLADAPTAETGRPAAVAEALARFPDPGFAGALVTHVRGAAADAEEAGAVILAREILTDLCGLSAHAPPLDRGGVFLQLGRISRTLGELDRAVDLLRAAGDLGRTQGVPELVAREALGEAVVARTRGNYPAARRLFQTALDGALTLGLADVQGMCHQGLMIVAGEAGDFDAALLHGWQALSAARELGAREAETLGNLAQLCAKAGYDVAALGGYSAALARTDAPRVRLPVLAGIATSAARLGDAKRVADVERAISSEASDVFPFETSGAWLALAQARKTLGDAAASDAAASKAAAIAHANGYHEIAHRVQSHSPMTPAPLADTGMGVIKSLEAWCENPAAGLAISNAPTD